MLDCLEFFLLGSLELSRVGLKVLVIRHKLSPVVSSCLKLFQVVSSCLKFFSKFLNLSGVPVELSIIVSSCF